MLLSPPLPFGNHKSDLYVCESVSVLYIEGVCLEVAVGLGRF